MSKKKILKAPRSQIPPALCFYSSEKPSLFTKAIAMFTGSPFTHCAVHYKDQLLESIYPHGVRVVKSSVHLHRPQERYELQLDTEKWIMPQASAYGLASFAAHIFPPLWKYEVIRQGKVCSEYCAEFLTLNGYKLPFDPERATPKMLLEWARANLERVY